MNTLKYILLTAIGSLSLGTAAQNYEVKGVVIDAKGNPVVGATVRTNKSKAVAITKEGGVYTLTATPKDTEIRLIMNKYTVMEKDLSASIATNPIAFELDEQTDPAITGYIVGDTYYPGEKDVDIPTIISSVFGIDIKKFGFGIFAIKDGQEANVQLLTELPTHIYSMRYLRDGTSYGAKAKDGVVIITTKAYHNEISSSQKAVISSGRDTIRGRVTDGWGRPAPDLKITTPSGETTVTNDSGYYAIRVTKKDKFLRCIMPYTEGTTVRIAKENWNQPINLTVMLRQNDLRGWLSEDMKTYYLGAEDVEWESVFQHFPTAMYNDGTVKFRRHLNTSMNIEGFRNAIIVLNGVPLDYLSFSEILPTTVHSVRIVEENAVPLYGPAAQFGAVEIVTKGMNNMAPVALADFDGQKAKRKGGVEGMKEYIAMQGKNIEYHEDGYITIDGKRCGLYIINDSEFTHMRGIEVDMIDEIMIVRSGVEGSYGPRAKNGVVLISASQKEKKVVDEKGNTVSEKEYKKQQRKTR